MNLKVYIIYTRGLQKKVISMGDQIQQFSTVRSNITKMTGSDAATDAIISKAFFLISVGSNDIFEYMYNITRPPMTAPEFNATLVSTYEYHLKVCHVPFGPSLMCLESLLTISIYC